MTEASSKGVMRLKPTMFLTDQPDTTHVNESNNRPGGLHRRDLLKGVAAASLVFATAEHSERRKSLQTRLYPVRKDGT